MAKFRKNDIVDYKVGRLTKKTVRGVIRDVRKTLLAESKRVKFEYVVEQIGKDGSASGIFTTTTKKALTLVEHGKIKNKRQTTAKKPTYYAYKVDNTVCGRVVTVVAKVEDEKFPVGIVEKSQKNLTACAVINSDWRKLSIGFAIMHESDEDNPTTGASVAKKRCERNPLSIYYSPNQCEFREDVVESICMSKMRYICDNIDKFIGNNEK